MNILNKIRYSLPKAGKLSEIPASWIDKIYVKSNNSWYKKPLRALEVRMLFTLFFPILALVDTVGAILAACFYRIVGNRKLAAKKYDLSIKNLLGFLAFPLGIINPNLVSFYFIPKKNQANQVVSGGKLYTQTAVIEQPKTIKRLQSIVKEAAKQGQKISIIGAGKSQGQQFMPTDNNIAIDMSRLNQITINAGKKTATVDAGATWGDLQLKANQHHLAVKVMQASNIFSIGGSIGTNIHGWHKAGTVANTIKSLTIMDPSGKIKKLTPKDELFGYVIGGFGQFGIVLKAEIKLAKNHLLTEKSETVTIKDYVNYFYRNVKNDKKAKMHLFRLSLDSHDLLGEGVAVNYVKEDTTSVVPIPDLQKEPKRGQRFERIAVNFLRNTKSFRNFYWRYEKRRLLNNQNKLTANEIMHPPINAMFNNSESQAEWLQEYFIPGKNLEAFLQELSSLLKANDVPLINATVRYVAKDNITKMGYANKGDRFAVVLCFNQLLRPEEIIKSKKWIREATELSLKHKGTFYLPYQAVASEKQFEQGYPTARKVAEKKKKVDPENRFSSRFAEQYVTKKRNDRHFYKNILASKQRKELFGGFLENILQRVDKDKLYHLLEDILSYADTKEQIYTELRNRIAEIKPSMLQTTRQIFKSLNTIKQDLSEQAKALMSDRKDPINGMIEIGYPGRFIRSFKRKLNIQGDISVVNTEESMTDYIQSGFPRPYNRFVPLNDYQPLSQNDYKDNSVDLITCFIGLHHIPTEKLDAFLASIRRVLRPGGTFLLVDHDVTNESKRDYANLAHSVYNAVYDVPVAEEMNEIRNFKSMKEWQTILARHGLAKTNARQGTMIREGDPTVNTMVRFTNMKEVKAKIKQQVEKKQVKPLLNSYTLRRSSRLAGNTRPIERTLSVQRRNKVKI
ncbi:FAD-binding protein [Candidatus Berkiella aquae]|uniref:FAD-binding protein n=1 Tax=Candidatus Berkiella aquae TaxID=295108 RepID=A0A0Q9YPL6_9GAMM|nr:FAD-binding protein [Candidatus Berkiella aquae]MCS5711888.1 FAD-binding protein [Candidatus Berkiella aquae]